MKPRVVLIPGLMGSALKDSRRKDHDHRILAHKHWDAMPRVRDALKARGNELVGSDSELVWGRFQFFHWLADVKTWLEILSRGDGYGSPAGVEPKDLTEVVVQMGKGKQPFEFRPYATLIKTLGLAQADLFVFPFDWRLRVNLAAAQLNAAVLRRWFQGRVPDKPLAEEEKVMLIGHSLGGLVARLFVEDPTYEGARVVRHAIMVATPNKGAPNAFGYFTGAKRFFQDTPAWKSLEALQALWRFYFPSSASSPLCPVTSVDDKRLVERFASIIQLFPTYDFVHFADDPAGKKKQKYADTYRPEFHGPTSKKVMAILGEVDGPLRDGKNLDAWLSRFDITYDFIGATQLLTNTAMVKGREKNDFKMKAEKKGDGTVPTFSSLDWIRQDKTLRAIHCKAVDLGRSARLAQHPELCGHPDVQELCLSRLRHRPKIGSGLKGRMDRGNIKQYDAIAREIFLSRREPFAGLDRRRTLVVCYALINGVDDKSKLIRTEKDEVGDETRLRYPPAGVLLPAVVYGGNVGNVRYEYVLLSTRSNTPGGVLFLPRDGEGFLHLFGIIATPWFDPCENEGHAEMQFHHWFEAQRPNREWQSSVASIFLWNESLTGAGGYSPCSKCCDELASMWRPPSALHRFMHWNTLFVGTETCRRETTEESLSKMRNAEWKLFGPPPPKKPQPQMPKRRLKPIAT